MLSLFGREFRIQHEIGHADDAVHRRADLVAHVRQELALGPVGRLGGAAPGRPQVGLCPVAIRGVLHDSQDLDGSTVEIADDAALRANPMQRPVGPTDSTLQRERAGPEGLVEGTVNRGDVPGHDTRQEIPGAPVVLRRGIAEYLVVLE